MLKLKTNINKMAEPYITPLPTPELLGVSEHGTSWTVPTIQPYCSCGIPIGSLEYEIAKMRAETPEKDPAELYRDVANKFKLKMCCRNLVLNRVFRAIVSADIGAFHNVAASSDAPPPTTDSNKTCPPPLIYNHRRSS